VAVIDLHDFETKQILNNPITTSDHGGTFVTPDTEWVIEGGQYAAPLGYKYASIDKYADEYRGMVTFWKFDRAAGRLLPDESFALELPPYWQDLCDAGKLASAGYIFCNSFNTEMATGGIEDDNPPFEAGASQRDMDYLHVINIQKAVDLVAAGRAVQIEFEAEAYKEQKIKKAQGDADRFLALLKEYRNAKDVTYKRLYLETMEEIMGQARKLVVDSGNQGVIQLLPLQELFQMEPEAPNKKKDSR